MAKENFNWKSLFANVKVECFKKKEKRVNTPISDVNKFQRKHFNQPAQPTTFLK
jgi:hypothetical protein